MVDQFLLDHPVDQVQSDPAGAHRWAEGVLKQADLATSECVVAWWTLGLVMRERSDAEKSLDYLTTAHTLAIRDGMAELAAEVAVSLALLHAHRGASTIALDLLAEAEPNLAGRSRGRLLMQRALVHYRQGDLQAASAGYTEALEILRSSGDEVAESRLCADLGLLETRQARFDVADELLRRSMAIADRCGQAFVHAVALHNWGFLAVQEGRLPLALGRLAQAEVEYRQLENTDGVGLVEADRAVAFASSGLSAESQAAVDAAIDALRESGNRVDLADVLVLGAELSVLSGDAERGTRQAREAIELCRQDGREIMAIRAELVELESKVASIVKTRPAERVATAARAEYLALRLGRLGWISDAAHGWTIVAAAAAGRDDALHELAIRRFRRIQRVASIHDRIRVKVLLGQLAVANGQPSRARRLITDGLNEVLLVSQSLGALEMRAHLGATTTLADLAQLAFRLELDSGDARSLLRRSEQVRRTSVDRPLVQQDHEVLEHLAQLRVINQELRLVDDRSAIARRALLLERAEREDKIRRRTLERTGRSGATHNAGPAVLRQLGDRKLLEYVAVDGVVHGVLAHGRRLESFEVGPESAIRVAQEHAEFAMHRLNRAIGSEAARTAASQLLKDSLAELAEWLVPAGVAPTAATVVVPASVLYGIPWNAVLGVAGGAISVAPSLDAWSRCTTRSRQGRRRALIAGPDLTGAEREVAVLSNAGHGDDVVLHSDGSDVSTCLRVLAEADIAHLACHGSFRLDNPMFSALKVADGDLTVYDLEQCERLPHTMVLSACNAGQNAVLRGGALLGMASALIQLGVASVIAPLTPVNDERSVDLMARLHEHLAAGLEPAAALAHASIGQDGKLDPTAAPFVCFGS